MVERRTSILSFRRKTSHDGTDNGESQPTPPEPVRNSQSSATPTEEDEIVAVIQGISLGGDASEDKSAVLGTSEKPRSARGLFRRVSTSMKSSLHGPKARRLNSVSEGSSIRQYDTRDPRPKPEPAESEKLFGLPADVMDDISATRQASAHNNRPRPASQTSTKAPKKRKWWELKAARREYRRRAAATTGFGNRGEFARFNPEAPPLPHFVDPLKSSYDPARGAAARASAAEHNANMLHRKDTKTSMKRPMITDSESAICLDSTYDTEDSVKKLEKPKLKQDPVRKFPWEIVAQIFSNFDRTLLVRAERVSKAWNYVATNGQIWRAVFNAHYQPKVPMTPPSFTMGGVGLGEARAYQDWKKMYQIRRAIERRWLAGSPVAIYLNGHTDSVYCCQFDEDKIITGSRDRTIRVWDLHTYQCLKVIGGPGARPLPNTPTPLETHPSNKHVQPRGNRASVNGTKYGESIYHIPAYYHTQSILCLQFDKEIVVTGSSDTTCIVWDIKTWEPIHRLEKHKAGVLDVCFDAKYIISCSKDSTICVWSRETGDLIKVLEGHKGPVNAVQLRGDKLVSASGDGRARIWCMKELKSVMELLSHDRGLAAVEFSDDAKYVLAGGNDMVVYKFDVASGEVVNTYRGHTGLVRSLFLDVHNNRVLSGSYDQSIRVSKFREGHSVAHYENWTTSWILSAKADYRRIVATSQDGRCLVMDFGFGIENVDILGANWSRLVEEKRIDHPYGLGEAEEGYEAETA
ncbi:hypothetical protein H2201_007400 [Coniosporium apollinis]|uniref:F-box domain-containing protein n=1 Tax=Coniosporium apollinis TaxID=61459 RepID=A0ABQ9NLU1_9PEZI|nr:hypothetical protein H2201_007400 [Coniosporium apollinis]